DLWAATCGLRPAGCGIAACALQAVQKAGEWIKAWARSTQPPMRWETPLGWHGAQSAATTSAPHFHAPGDMPKMHSQNVHAQHVHAQSESRIVWAALPTGAFMVAKAVGPCWRARWRFCRCHMLIDAVSLALAGRAFCIARQRTYGFHLSRCRRPTATACRRARPARGLGRDRAGRARRAGGARVVAHGPSR